MRKIAFIGLGSMGAPQARLIARASFDLTVYDPYPPALDAFDGIARLAASPGDAARHADIVCICVRDDDQVRAVIFGDGGVAAAIDAGAMIVICSTIRADTLRSIRDDLAARRVSVIDAAVSRTRQTDDDRFVVSIVGGEEEDVARIRPLLDTFSTEIVHVGAAGAGVAAKIANNMITWINIVTAAQASAMAEANGVSIEKLRSILKANGNLTPIIGGILDGRAAAGANHDPKFLEFLLSQTGIGQKDLALAAESLDLAGLDDGVALAARHGVRFALTGANA